MKVFAKRLNELRTERGLTTRELGEQLGVSHTAICSWENNKSNIKAEELFKVAKFFNVPSDYLIGLKDFY